jgi:aspartate carbamoyltransferase catalytic subunit
MGLAGIPWEKFRDMDAAAKAPLYLEDGRLFHVIIAQQFDRDSLEALGALATEIRFMAKSAAGGTHLRNLLPNQRAMLYFTQPSTRTFLSFCAACQILGMRIGEVREPSTSSEYKGESQEDSVRTFSSYFDLIVMRTRTGGLAERMAWVLSNAGRPIPIINAGSGKDQHPTQALLDVYTLQRSFETRGGIDGKCIVFVGDLGRGRTVRSLASLLTNYRGVRLVFVAPEKLQISGDILDMLRAKGVPYEIGEDFERSIRSADAVYMTRIQDEWDSSEGESARIDTSRFCFTRRHLDMIGPNTVIMHPFPRRAEISPDVDADPRAVYWRQMRNGMWIRAALIATIFRRDGDIRGYHA